MNFARKDVFERSSIFVWFVCLQGLEKSRAQVERSSWQETNSDGDFFSPLSYIICSSYPSSIHIVWVALSFLIHPFVCKRFSWEGFCRKSRTRNLIYVIFRYHKRLNFVILRTLLCISYIYVYFVYFSIFCLFHIIFHIFFCILYSGGNNGDWLPFDLASLCLCLTSGDSWWDSLRIVFIFMMFLFVLYCK